MASMIRSGVVEYKAPFVLKHDFSPNFPLRLMHKDIHLMLDAGKSAGVPLPGTETIDTIYEKSTAAGYKDEDYAATLKVMEEMAGLK
jgi:3-hydroxyisobutyrate dehydrogenase-like beta-hydroxyacid dehydrogenase